MNFRNIFLLLTVLVLFYGCGTSDTKKNTTVIRDTTIIQKKDLDVAKPATSLRTNDVSMIGNWTITGYYIAHNVTAIGEDDAKKMIGKSVLRIYPKYIADATDSCEYDKIDHTKTNADKYFAQDEIKKTDLKVTNDNIDVISFTKTSLKGEQNTCSAANSEIVNNAGEYLFYIEGVYFVIKRSDIVK